MGAQAWSDAPLGYAAVGATGADAVERAAAAYRGDDRRGLLHEDRAITPAIVATAVLVVAALVLLVTTSGWSPVGPRLVHLVEAQLVSAAFALTIPVAVLCFVRWRFVGEATLLWIGGAALVHGFLTLGFGAVIGGTYAPTAAVLTAVPSAGHLTSLALVVAALRAPDVDAGLRPVKVAAVACLTAVATASLLAGLPGGPPAALDAGWPGAAVALCWAGLAIWAARRGWHHRRQVLVWFGLAFAVFAASELLSVVPATDGSVGDLAPSVLHLVGLLLGVVAATSGLIRAFVRQGGRLMRAVTAELSAEAHIAAEEAAYRERVHEARNALAAIEMGTFALQLEDRDTYIDRSALSQGVVAELRRLAELIDPVRAPTEIGPFRLSDALVGLAVAMPGRSLPLSVDVPDHLTAIGRAAETTQVLHNLLQNAQRYGAGKVAVTAEREGDDVVIRVEDDGPGIPRTERSTIFDRGVRGSWATEAVAGDGLGLHIARRLMLEQGGSLVLEEERSAGVGACFSMRLPAAPSSTEELVDEHEEPRQVVSPG